MTDTHSDTRADAHSAIEYTIGPFAAVAMGLPGDHAGKTATRVFLVTGGDKLALIDSGIHVGYDQLKAALASSAARSRTSTRSSSPTSTWTISATTRR